MALTDLLSSCRKSGLPALLLGAALISPAQAQQTPTPSETVSSHDDWRVRCTGAGDKRECEAVQTLQPTSGKGVLAHVAVRAEKNGPVRLITQVPPGVWLPANITLKVAGVPDVVLTYKRCGQSCIASAELKADELTALKASAGEGDLVFENGSRQPVTLPLSFKGLGAALTASLNR